MWWQDELSSPREYTTNLVRICCKRWIHISIIKEWNQIGVILVALESLMDVIFVGYNIIMRARDARVPCMA